MKPIEPGCKCIIIHDKYTPENVGKVVTVIRCYPPGSNFLCRDTHGELGRFETKFKCWSTSESIHGIVFSKDSQKRTPIVIKDLMGADGSINGLVAEPRLMRIDGDDFDDNPYKEKEISFNDRLMYIQGMWMNSPETWEEYQRKIGLS